MTEATSIGVDDSLPAFVKCLSSATSLTLDPRREYFLHHMGYGFSGALSAVTSATIFFSQAVGAVSSYAPSTDKWALQGSENITVGPGLNKLIFKTKTGQPIFMAIPGQRHLDG